MTAKEVFKKLEGMIHIKFYLSPSEYDVLKAAVEPVEPIKLSKSKPTYTKKSTS